MFLTRKEVETLALNNIIGSVRKNSQTLKGYCVIASHIFSKVSNNLGYDVKIIKGKYCILGSFSMNPDNQNYHFWNEYNDLIIDLTASQFISDKIYCGPKTTKYWELESEFKFDYSDWSFRERPTTYPSKIDSIIKNLTTKLL